MVRNHQGNKQPIEPSLVNQTTSKADYTTKPITAWLAQSVEHLTLRIISKVIKRLRVRARVGLYFCSF